MAIYFRFASLPEVQGLSATERNALVGKIPVRWWGSAGFVGALAGAIWLGDQAAGVAAQRGFSSIGIVLTGALTTGALVWLYALIALNTWARKGLQHARAAA